MTYALPNLVRHEICIVLHLMYYSVTHYEYYITNPQTLSITGRMPFLGMK